MKSYSGLNSLYGKLTLDNSSANLTLGAELVNDDYRQICSMRDFPFLRRLRTCLTDSTSQFVALPYDVDQVESCFVTVSSVRYTPKLIHSREQWDQLNRSTFTSDIPKYAFVYNGTIGLWPAPATSSNVISVNAKVRVIDLNTTDITSVTITTATNGSTAIVASGSLTTPMAGLWLRITYSTTANKGDGVWYEISSVSSATAATLVRKYGGTSIAAGTAACTIAQMPLLPENFHELPVYGPVAAYWATVGNAAKAAFYEKKKEDGIKALVSQYANAVSDPVLDDGLGSGDVYPLNPNLFPHV